MLKYMAFFVAIIAIAGLLISPASAAKTKQPRQAIMVLIENGGTVENTEQALTTVKHLLGQLTMLKRRRATRNAQISIVLSASPNHIAWSGSPDQLQAQGQKVLDMVVFKPTFSDLVLAWKQINTTLELSMPDSFRLYWIGPGIHVPFQEATEELHIKVPQEVDLELLAGALAKQSEVFKFYNVHADQDEIYLEYFRSFEILDRTHQGQMEFRLMDAAQTESQLDDLL